MKTNLICLLLTKHEGLSWSMAISFLQKRKYSQENSLILVVKGFCFKLDQPCQQNRVSFHYSGLKIEFGKFLKWRFNIQSMTFWPLVLHILILLFLKTKLHQDLLVEWTQTYIMWKRIGSICQRLHQKDLSDHCLATVWPLSDQWRDKLKNCCEVKYCLRNLLRVHRR